MRNRDLLCVVGVALALTAPRVAGADEAAKEALKRAKALAACQAEYSSAIDRCRSSSSAVACYAAADAADLACREELDAAGHSDIAEPSMSPARKRPPVGVVGRKRALVCQTGLLLQTGCADGHAGVPFCNQSSQEAIQAGQGILNPGPGVVVDASGAADRCSNGTRLKCHPGFAVSPREGADLCWDSSSNRDRFDY